MHLTVYSGAVPLNSKGYGVTIGLHSTGAIIQPVNVGGAQSRFHNTDGLRLTFSLTEKCERVFERRVNMYEVMDSTDVAEFLRCSQKQAVKIMRQLPLIGLNRGRYLKILKADLIDWLEGHRKGE